MGGYPAAVVRQLKSNGQRLEDVNAAVRELARRRGVQVLSLAEGLPMRVAYVKTQVVPLESAYPGYGELAVLPEHDHISVCKPLDRGDPAYTKTLDLLRRCERRVEERGGGSGAAADPHPDAPPAPDGQKAA